LDRIDAILASFGKHQHQPNFRRFLTFDPDVEVTEEVAEDTLLPSKETIGILFEEIESGNIDPFVIDHLKPLFREWQKKIK
jgi:hypothetical protein